MRQKKTHSVENNEVQRHYFQDGNGVYPSRYSQEMNGNHRNKRAVDPSKVTCEVYMQADHLYYERYYNDTDTVIEKLTQHVQALNNIFPAIGEYRPISTLDGSKFRQVHDVARER